MNGYLSSMSTTIIQSLTFIIFIVSEKIATLKSLLPMDTQPAGLTLVITLTHISYESKKKIPHVFDF